jgi:hypothetical protein
VFSKIEGACSGRLFAAQKPGHPRRITKVTRLEPPDCGILMAMKTKNMRELEKMWAKKASEQSNPQQKAGAPTRQSPAPATRTARKASRGR